MLVTSQPEGKVLEVNEACEQMFRIARDKVIGRSIQALAPWQETDGHGGYLEELGREGRIEARRVKLRRRDGEAFEAIVSTELQPWRGVVCRLSTITDVSAEARVREALAALNAVPGGDPLRVRADELTATIQRQLLAAARAAQASQPEVEPRRP